MGVGHVAAETGAVRPEHGELAVETESHREGRGVEIPVVLPVFKQTCRRAFPDDVVHVVEGFIEFRVAGRRIPVQGDDREAVGQKHCSGLVHKLALGVFDAARGTAGGSQRVGRDAAQRQSRKKCAGKKQRGDTPGSDMPGLHMQSRMLPCEGVGSSVPILRMPPGIGVGRGTPGRHISRIKINIFIHRGFLLKNRVIPTNNYIQRPCKRARAKACWPRYECETRKTSFPFVR